MANLGHTIQRMINNTPAAVSVNATTTTVVTSGGGVFQAGLIGSRIQDTFKEVLSNQDIVGRVVDAQSTDCNVYFLNDTGSVFQYNYNQGNPSCNPRVREVYSPCVCNGDPAIEIATGREHCIILTAAKKVFGVGSNENYQIVPQGQCEYDIAVEMIIVDTNLHDNSCCCAFSGTITELTTPVLPAPNPCNNVSCVSSTQVGAPFGTASVALSGLTFNGGSPSYGAGDLLIPVLIDYSYNGFLCGGANNTTSGNVTLTITRVYIAAGAYPGTYTVGLSIIPVNLVLSDDVTLFDGSTTPFTVTTQVSGTCGTNAFIVPAVTLSTLTATQSDQTDDFILSLGEPSATSSNVGVINAAEPLSASPETVTVTPDPIPVFLNCCAPVIDCCKAKCPIPQPCWMSIWAGGNNSVLVDSCNRLFVLGSIHQVRNNHDLLKRGCLDRILDGTNATITLPADQLSCWLKPQNNDCKCVDCQRRCKTDLSKFGVQLSFPNDC